jgi:modulator of FtsH protease
MDIAYSATEWGGFGTTAATAAATLTGLLFIAVSINLQKILEAQSLPGRAAMTLLFFAIPLVASLLLVVPEQARAVLGGELVATGAVGGASALIIGHRAGRSQYEPRWSLLGTRLIPMGGNCLCIIVAGVSLAAQAGGGLYWLVPATVLAITAGLINTWVLMVEIMR